jgi:hypothetical protein
LKKFISFNFGVSHFSCELKKNKEEIRKKDEEIKKNKEEINKKDEVIKSLKKSVPSVPNQVQLKTKTVHKKIINPYGYTHEGDLVIDLEFFILFFHYYDFIVVMI